MDTTTAAPHERSQGLPPVAVEPAATGFRTDIQALRAVAVMAVVFNHLWPSRLSGGYVGVDVFFVISGFLISSHLDRELTSTGRIRLARFYARRIRRLLPAALLVLVLSAVAAYLLLPFPLWAATAQELVASALYWENWLLAAHSVDYSDLTAVASLAQHYWSLSVEEQFYLVWPVLLLALFRLRRRTALVVGMATAGVGSLGFSVLYTDASPSQAYFATPARLWEFALGALIALGGARLAMSRVAANLAALAGLAMIVGSALRYDHLTPFPGYLALVPAVGTGLVIAAGARPGRQWHTPLSATPPVQFLGNVSYSLYLWHWPLIVLAPFALGEALDHGRLTTPQRLGILAAAIGLAAVSKVLVEDRGRTWGRLTSSTKASFAAMVAGITVVALAAGGLHLASEQRVAQARHAMLADVAGPCHGAAARIPGNRCAAPYGPARVVHMSPANEYWHQPPECGGPVRRFTIGSTPTTWFCDFTKGALAPRTVWLVGDSHAQQWTGPLVELARERHWLLKLSFLGGCPVAGIEFRGFQATWDDALTQRCMGWTARLSEAIVDDRPDLVFTSFFARQERADDRTGRSQTAQYRDGLTAYWREWTAAGARVAVLADPPLNVDVRATDCVALNPMDPVTCAVDRAIAQPPDPLTTVARTSGVPGVVLVDLTDYFCDEDLCYAVVGHVAVYYDANHLNVEFSRSLKPMIAEAIDRVGG